MGNECNNLVGAKNREEASNRTMIIAIAIKSADSSRPIVSGMHGIGVDGTWQIEDQAQNADILTTHPYPYWRSHCSEGKVTSVQTLMHATCETKYYSNIGGKPCFAEEIGTMGPMVCDDETSGNFMKPNLYSNWANGSTGVLWWCANEQIDLMYAPYDLNMCEVELGMFDRNRKVKPVLEETKKFASWQKRIDFELPEAINDAVCLTTDSQDQWGVMYSAYVLAKDENGMPIFTKFKYGKGTVYYLNFHLEKNMIGVCDAFDGEQHEVYKEVLSEISEKYVVTSDNKYIGLTRHGDGNDQRITLINYSDKPQKTGAKVADSFKYEVLKGDLERIEPFEMTIVKLTK